MDNFDAFASLADRFEADGSVVGKPSKRAVRARQVPKKATVAPALDIGRTPQGIVLDYPPGQNDAIQPVRFGRGIRARIGIAHTAKAKAWIAKAKADVSGSGLVPFDGPVRVTIIAYPPSLRSDIDGILKKPLDALQSSQETNGKGAYRNDRQVRILQIEFAEVSKDNARVEISVAPITKKQEPRP